ncbi:hypothetical protein Tco_1164320 [Tanacetum coccineum]
MAAARQTRTLVAAAAPLLWCCGGCDDDIDDGDGLSGGVGGDMVRWSCDSSWRGGGVARLGIKDGLDRTERGYQGR